MIRHPSDVNEGEQIACPAVMSSSSLAGRNVVGLEPDDSSSVTGASSVDGDPHEACVYIERTNDADDADEVGEAELGVDNIATSSSLIANENGAKKDDEKQEEKKIDEEEMHVDEDESDRNASFSPGCDSLAEQKNPAYVE